MNSPQPSVPLTKRECQVIGLLLQGCDGPMIAEELKVARDTIKKDFMKLFRKYGLWDGTKHRQVLLALKLSGQCTEPVQETR
jgi:ATP/maltotriose-dependent transcriptional regulator MalT